MKNILILALLSVFMAMPASAERMFIDHAKFASTPADPTIYATPTGYQWQVFRNSVWVVPMDSTGVETSKSLTITITGPKLMIQKLKVAGTLNSTVGPSSNESEEFSINPDLDCNKDGKIGAGDYVCILATLNKVLGKKIVNGEYVN
jgi:hypothetical protein